MPGLSAAVCERHRTAPTTSSTFAHPSILLTDHIWALGWFQTVAFLQRLCDCRRFPCSRRVRAGLVSNRRQSLVQSFSWNPNLHPMSKVVRCITVHIICSAARRHQCSECRAVRLKTASCPLLLLYCKTGRHSKGNYEHLPPPGDSLHDQARAITTVSVRDCHRRSRVSGACDPQLSFLPVQSISANSITALPLHTAP